MEICLFQKLEYFKKNILILVFLGLIFNVKSTLHAQIFQWAKDIGGTDVNEGKAVAIDAQGNVYTVGNFVGTMDFDPGPNTFNLTCTYNSNFNNGDFYISKLNASGQFVWAKKIGDYDNDHVLSITLDSLGNIYTTGCYGGTVDFDPGPGIYNLTSSGLQKRDVFILKLDVNGNFIWAKSLGLDGFGVGRSIKLDNDGNIYASGSFTGTFDFDPNFGSFNLTSSHSGVNSSPFILKLDATGSFLWAESFTGFDNSANINSIAIDSYGNVLSTGAFIGLLDFDPGVGTYNLTASNTYSDVFVSKLNSAGNFVWAKSFGGGFDDYGASLVVDEIGNVYTVGNFQGNTDFDPGPGYFYASADPYHGAYTLKLDTAGNFKWVRTLKSSSFDAFAMDIDTSGNVYSMGSFSGEVDFEPGLGVSNLNSVNGNHYISVLNSDGGYVWAINYGTSALDYPSSTLPFGDGVGSSGLVLDGKGCAYTTGIFIDTGDFDPSLYSTFNLTSAGSRDAFICKMKLKGVFGKIYNDIDLNCSRGSSEIGLANRSAIINPGNILVTTDSSGTWFLDSLSLGNYTITVDTSGNWRKTCPDTIRFSITNPNTFNYTSNIGIANLDPCPTFDIIANTVTICVGQTATIAASGATTYLWSTGATTSSANVVPTTTSIYTVTGTSSGCSEAITTTVTVNPKPVVSSTLSSICFGQTASLLASGADTYLWSTGATTSSLTVTPTATTVYTVTGTNTATGCSKTITTSVTIKPLPIITVHSATACIGQAATLTATGANTYLWNTGDLGATLTISPVIASDTYTVSGTNSITGCSNSAVGTITYIPSVAPIVASTSVTVCNGQRAVVKASGADTYLWNTGISLDSLIINPATTTTNYIVTGTSISTGCSDTAIGTIVVNGPANLSATSTSLCLGQSATIVATGADTYVWNTGLTNDSLTINPTNTTTYTVTGTSISSGCSRTASGTITVKQIPSVSVTPSNSTICSGASQIMVASGIPGTNVNTTFSNSNSFSIPDNDLIGIASPIIVTGLPGRVGANLVSVSIRINHTFDADLDIYLRGPEGNIIELSTDNGNSGDNYMNTTFSTSGTPITSGFSPFTGTYIPEQSFSGLNTCNIDGTWSLVIIDDMVGDIGTLIGWSITFRTPNTYVWSPPLGLSATTGDVVVVTPSVSTNYTVVATDVSGCTNSTTANFTVNPTLAPIVMVSSTTVCSGQTAIITASGADTYVWNTGATSAGLTVNPATNTTTYSVTGTNNSTGCSNIATGTITVNPLPVVSSTSVTVCNGQIATITASGANNYTWNTGATTPALTINPATITNTYTVTGTSALGCTKTATGSITVNALPIVAVTSAYICAGQSATITASGANSYLWNTNVPTASITVAPSSTTIYTVTGTSTSTGCSKAVIGTITVNPLPTLTVSSTTLCSGQSATIVASGGNTYLWNTGETNASLTVSPALSTSSYSVIGTALATGCSVTATGSINVNQLPLVTANASSTIICIGDSTILSGIGTAASYVWSNGIIDGSAFAPIVTNTYTVTGTNVNGCSDTASISITVNPLPIINIISNASNICLGDSLTLNGSGGSVYSWQGGIIDGIAFAPVATNTYTLIGTDLNGCSDTAVATINVNLLPIVVASSTNTSVCEASSIALNATGNAITYSWSNGLLSGVSFVPTSSASYTLTGIDANGCDAMDSITVNVDNSCQVVWPGDANSDGLANNTDILELGIRYGSAGGQRTIVNNTWQEFNSPNWGVDTVSTGYNLNHADCDGNGAIDLDDTLAVNLNYGLTHTFRNAAPNKINSTSDIYFVSSQMVYGANQPIAIDVYLGESSMPLQKFYGAAFTLNYTDNSLIQPGSMRFSIDEVSWVGTINSNGIRLTKPDETSQSVYGAICRTNHSTIISGFGKIGTLRFMTTSNNVNNDFVLSAINSFYIDSVGNQTPLTSATFSVNINSSVGLQQQVSSLGVSIYPNPNNGTLTLNNLNPKEEYTAEVKDLLGRTIYTQQIKNVGATTTIKLNDASGVYWLQLSTKKAKEVCKIVVE